MRRSVLCFCMLVSLLGTSSLSSAQSTQKPHMDLVRALRKEGLADLALQYLNELKAGNPAPDVAVLMPLEFARTYLDLAAVEMEEGKRTNLISKAKKELETFLSANPKHDLAPQANVELARLLSLQGKNLLRKARRIEDKKLQEPEMKKARDTLKAAADKYLATSALLDAHIKKLDGDPGAEKLRKELSDFRMRSLLDQGINLFEMGETFVGEEPSDIDNRGKQFKASHAIFEKIMYQDDKLPIAWVAKAWAAQTELKAGEPGKAEKAFADLLSRRNVPAAAAGIRVARYFTILNNFEKSDKDERSKFSKLDNDCAVWLRDYPTYRDTQEGLGARWYQALAKLKLGTAGILVDKNKKMTGITATGKTYLEDAQRIFKDLAETENEYTDRANHLRSQILVSIADAEGHGDAPPVESLTTFERCYLLAQVQTARFIQYRSAKPPPKTEDDQKKYEAELKKEEVRRYTNSLRYLEHGLEIVTRNDNLRDVFSAQLFLVGCYIQLKLYPQAAVLAEHLARTNPKMNKASSAAHASLQAYNLAYNNLRHSGDVPPEVIASEGERLRRAAQFLIDQWPTDAAADEARRILAFFLAADKKFQEAWKTYSEITASYPRVRSARFELASVMFTLIYPTDEKNPEAFTKTVAARIKQYESQWNRTIALVESVTEPDDEADLEDVAGFLDCRAQLARMYQLEGKQEKAAVVGESLLKAIDTFRQLKDAQKTNLTHTAQNIILGSLRAIAYKDFQSGNYAKVAEVLNPKIAEIEKDFAKGAPVEPTRVYDQLRKTERAIVILALQSSIQDQKIDRAGKLIDVLEKSGASTEESLGLMQTLVANVRSQIVALEADKKTDEANKLKAGFTELLDKIVARGAKMPAKMKMFLASGYSSVEANAKAAELLIEIRAQKAPNPPAPLPAGATPEQEAKYKQEQDEYDGYTRTQQQAQFVLARTYRAAKNYPEAMKIFDEMIGKITPKVPVPPLKDRGWAFKALLVRKEKAALLEEMALAAEPAKRTHAWSAAVQEWVAIQKTFAPQLYGIRKSISPQDEMFNVLKNIVAAKKDSEPDSCPVQRFIWTGHQFGPLLQSYRDKIREEASANANKRATYFELFFEQKRCSVMAFWKIGVGATKGNAEVYNAKFGTFAKDFHDLQAKNPDLSQSLKDKIKELVDNKDLRKDVPIFHQEYLRLQTGN